MRILLIGLLAVASAPQAFAEVWKCHRPTGVVYSSHPCMDAKVEKVEAMTTVLSHRKSAYLGELANKGRMTAAADEAQAEASRKSANESVSQPQKIDNESDTVRPRVKDTSPWSFNATQKAATGASLPPPPPPGFQKP